MRSIPYAPAEQTLLDILKDKQGKPLDTLSLTDLAYPEEDSRPFRARESVVTTMNVLMKKIAANKEKFKICRTDRRGPHPIQFWIEE